MAVPTPFVYLATRKYHCVKYYLYQLNLKNQDLLNI